jgi:hypothetical protein
VCDFWKVLADFIIMCYIGNIVKSKRIWQYYLSKYVFDNELAIKFLYGLYLNFTYRHAHTQRSTVIGKKLIRKT